MLCFFWRFRFSLVTTEGSVVVEVAVCAERVRTTTDENGGLPLTTTDVHVGCELRSNNEQPAKRL